MDETDDMKHVLDAIRELGLDGERLCARADRQFQIAHTSQNPFKLESTVRTLNMHKEEFERIMLTMGTYVNTYHRLLDINRERGER